MARFRFQDVEIWKDGVRVTNRLMDLADGLEERKLFKFAEQLRGAALSITNNIAEGSGSTSQKEFRNFLNFARGSAFESASMLFVFLHRKLVQIADCDESLAALEILCRRITQFQRAL